MPEPYRVVSALPTGTAVSRYIIAKAIGRGDYWTELQIAEQWRDTPASQSDLGTANESRSPGRLDDRRDMGRTAQLRMVSRRKRSRSCAG